MMEKKSAEPKKLHSGKWTLEEEAYVEGLMEEFRAGTLHVQEGTTLRSFLAQKLNCKPKRISKKYEGKNYDGKQLYWKTEDDISAGELRMRRSKLQQLEAKFKECLKAIEIAKTSRQSLPASAADGLDHAVTAAAEAKEADIMGSPASAALAAGTAASFFLQGGYAPAPASFPPPPTSGLSDFYRGSTGATLGSQILARQRQLQAMESFAAASGSPLLHASAASLPQQPSSRFSSMLSRPSASAALATARQDALFGAGQDALFGAGQDALFGSAGLGAGLPRPASPSAFEAAAGRLGLIRPPSPQTIGLLGQASALEQARLAMAVRNNSYTGAYSGAATLSAELPHSFRPSLNTMLVNRMSGGLGGRQTSGNRLASAQSAYEESLMRLQQPVRDLGALQQAQARRTFNEQKEQEEKRSLEQGDDSAQQQQPSEQQRKRQRFL